MRATQLRCKRFASPRHLLATNLRDTVCADEKRNEEEEPLTLEVRIASTEPFCNSFLSTRAWAVRSGPIVFVWKQ